MIGRAIAYVAAAAFSGCVLTGIGALILADLFGEDAPAKVWQRVTEKPARPPQATGVLDGAKDITFFAKVPSKEHGLLVVTGVAFETVKDFEAARQLGRWCYVMVDPRGALSRRVDLATQTRMEPPIYLDLSPIPSEELASAGLKVRTLHALAKSHCRFAPTNSRSQGISNGGRT